MVKYTGSTRSVVVDGLIGLGNGLLLIAQILWNVFAWLLLVVGQILYVVGIVMAAIFGIFFLFTLPGRSRY